MVKPIVDIATHQELPQLPELARLQLQNIFLQQQVAQGQLNTLTAQFLQTPSPRALQTQIDAITSELNATAERLFAEAKVDPRLYQLNIAYGTFVRRAQEQSDAGRT